MKKFLGALLVVALLSLPAHAMRTDVGSAARYPAVPTQTITVFTATTGTITKLTSTTANVTNAIITKGTVATDTIVTASITELYLKSPTAAATATAVATYNMTFEVKDANGVIYLIPAVAK